MTAPSGSDILTECRTNVTNQNVDFPTEDPGSEIPDFCDDLYEYKNTETLNANTMFQPLYSYNYLINIVNVIDDSWIESFTAIADGISACWQNWQNSFSVDGKCTIAPISPSGAPTTGTLTGFNTLYNFDKTNLAACIDMSYISTRDIGTAVVDVIGDTFSSELQTAWQSVYTASFVIVGTPGATNAPFLISTGTSVGDTNMTNFGAKLISNFGSSDTITNVYLQGLGDAVNTVFTAWKAASSISGIIAGGTIVPGSPPSYSGGPGTAGTIT